MNWSANNTAKLTSQKGVPTVHTTMTATITLKVPAKQKEDWQREARRAKQSLNAFVLGKVAGEDVSRRGKIDFDKLTAHMAGRFANEEAWRLIPGRE